MKLLDQVRHVIRKKHYSIRTEQAYTNWIKKFILFNGKRHPKDMGEKEISQYISYLAVKRNVAASTQNQALNAVVFLYKQILNRDLGDFGNMQRAKRPKKLAPVLVPHIKSKDFPISGLITSLSNLFTRKLSKEAVYSPRMPPPSIVRTRNGFIVFSFLFILSSIVSPGFLIFSMR